MQRALFGLMMWIAAWSCGQRSPAPSPSGVTTEGGSGGTTIPGTGGTGSILIDVGGWPGRGGKPDAGLPPPPPPDAGPIDATPPPPDVWEIPCEHPRVEKHCENGFCRIPSGCFFMGTPQQEWGVEPPAEQVHPVRFTHGFWIQQHESTLADWRDAGFAPPPEDPKEGVQQCLEPQCPVGNIMWFEAVALANAFSERDHLEPCYVLSDCTGKPGEKMTCTGVALTASTVYECKGYRLPTEAEWEYAARAGTRTLFFTGEMKTPPKPGSSECYEEPVLEPIAWYCNNSGRITHPVGQKQANPWGLFDVIGNVMEWTHDAEGPWPRPMLYINPGGELGDLVRARSSRSSTVIMWPWVTRTTWSSYGRSTGITLGTRLARTDWGPSLRGSKQ